MYHVKQIIHCFIHVHSRYIFISLWTLKNSFFCILKSMALNLQYFQCLCSKTASALFFLCLEYIDASFCVWTTRICIQLLATLLLSNFVHWKSQISFFFFKYYKIKCDFFLLHRLHLLLSVSILKKKYIYEKKSPFNCITRHTMKLSVKFFSLFFGKMFFGGFRKKFFLDFKRINFELSPAGSPAYF